MITATFRGRGGAFSLAIDGYETYGSRSPRSFVALNFLTGSFQIVEDGAEWSPVMRPIAVLTDQVADLQSALADLLAHGAGRADMYAIDNDFVLSVECSGRGDSACEWSRPHDHRPD